MENRARPTVSSDKYHKCRSSTDLAALPTSASICSYFLRSAQSGKSPAGASAATGASVQDLTMQKGSKLDESLQPSFLSLCQLEDISLISEENDLHGVEQFCHPSGMVNRSWRSLVDCYCGGEPKMTIVNSMSS